MREMFLNYVIMVCLCGFITSALVEVIKQVIKFKDNYQVNIVVLVTAELLSVLGYIIYCDVKDQSIVWYNIAVVLVGGIISSGIAMFGFDKYFKPLFKNIKDMIEYLGNK